jgi:hypothetical protein
LLLITPAAVSAIAVLSACGDSSIGIAMAATVLSGTLSCSSWVWVTAGGVHVVTAAGAPENCCCFLTRFPSVSSFQGFFRFL